MHTPQIRTTQEDMFSQPPTFSRMAPVTLGKGMGASSSSPRSTPRKVWSKTRHHAGLSSPTGTSCQSAAQPFVSLSLCSFSVSAEILGSEFGLWPHLILLPPPLHMQHDSALVQQVLEAYPHAGAMFVMLGSTETWQGMNPTFKHVLHSQTLLCCTKRHYHLHAIGASNFHGLPLVGHGGALINQQIYTVYTSLLFLSLGQFFLRRERHRYQNLILHAAKLRAVPVCVCVKCVDPCQSALKCVCEVC